MKQFVLKIKTFAESDGRKDFVEYPAKWIYLILATIYYVSGFGAIVLPQTMLVALRKVWEDDAFTTGPKRIRSS